MTVTQTETDTAVQAVGILERRLARAHAATEVQKQLSRFVYLFAAARFAAAAEHFTADAEVELRPGAAAGGDQLRAALEAAGASGPGALREWGVTTPLVYVDEDARSAQGTFIVVAAESTPQPDDGPTTEWAYSALSVGFAKVDGQWLISMLRVVPRFTTPFDQDWSTTARRAAAAGDDLPGYAPDRVAVVDPPLPPEVVFEEIPASALADSEVADLARRVTRLEDRWAIENLMSTHEYLHAGNRNDLEFEECFAHVPGLAFEPEDWGVWDGPDAVKACYVTGAPPAAPGILTEHTTTTSSVEIAEDGLSARGVWISPGHEAFAAPDGNDRVVWSWGRYGVDFLKIDGRWRFLRFHIYTTFRTDYGVDWVAGALAPRTLEFEEGEVPPGMEPPSRGVTANAPYHPERAPQLLPVPPEPYATWDESATYVPLP